MQWLNSIHRYGIVSKSFHWAIAILVMGMLVVGMTMVNMPTGISKLKVYGVHKSIGITILLLVTVRLVWRWSTIVPSLPKSVAAWQRVAAHANHVLLYLLLFYMPLTGWLMSSVHGITVSFYGWFSLPNLLPAQASLQTPLKVMHEIGAWTLVVLIALHIMAALWHYVYCRDDVLQRML